MTTRKRAPRDYSKGKIYKLECLNTGKVYVGHTTKQYLSQRLTRHKEHFNQWVKGKAEYYTALDIIAEGNYQITLLESYPCKSEDELKSRERYWIEITDGRINKNIPTRTHTEYYQVNHDVQAEKMRQYREHNRDALSAYYKQYYQDNRSKVKDKNNSYRAKNLDLLREKDRQRHYLRMEWKRLRMIDAS